VLVDFGRLVRAVRITLPKFSSWQKRTKTRTRRARRHEDTTDTPSSVRNNPARNSPTCREFKKKNRLPYGLLSTTRTTMI
jgi:hypothetical protein